MKASNFAAVGLVTIWYRSERHIDRFVTSLLSQTYPNILPVFVIHELPEESVTELARRVPHALVLRTGQNLGTAIGWNIGIAALQERQVEIFGMLNVDVRLSASCIERLVALFASDPTIGACQPMLFYSDATFKVEMYGGTYDVGTGTCQ